MRTFTSDTALAALELQQLVMDYWRDADFNDALGIPDFYTEDCVYVGGPQLTFNGREGMKKFYDNVRATKQSDRKIRHTITNLQVFVQDKDRATVNHIIVTYAKSGVPPIVGLTGPSQVTDVQLECRRESDGKWRIARFEGAPIFVGGDSLLNKLPKSEPR